MDYKTIILIAVVIVLLIILQRLGRRKGDGTRAARLMKQYAVMTREKLDSAPEGELVDAVVSNILARADAENPRHPDPGKTLAELAHGRTVVYSVWVVCKELSHSRFTELMVTPAAEFAELAQSGFTALGAEGCATGMAAMRAAADNKDEDALCRSEESFHAAVEQEQPLARCEDYIRDHAAEFLDEPEPEIPETTDNEEK